MDSWLPIVVGPALSLGTAALLFIGKWLLDVRASTARIEARQIEDGKKVQLHDRKINHLEQRTAGLEGALFKRPVIMEDEL